MAEEAIDTGREFWRLLVEEVVKEYCVGDPGMSIFTKNVPALQVSMIVCRYELSFSFFF